MSDSPIIFADSLSEANVANGVVRLRLNQLAANGQTVAAGTLIVPLGQLAPLANALNILVQQIHERARAEAAQRARPAGPVPPEGGVN